MNVYAVLRIGAVIVLSTRGPSMTVMTLTRAATEIEELPFNGIENGTALAGSVRAKTTAEDCAGLLTSIQHGWSQLTRREYDITGT